MELKFRIKKTETHQVLNITEQEFDNGNGHSTCYDISSDEKALKLIRSLGLKNVYLCMELPENYVEEYNKKLDSMTDIERKLFKTIEQFKHYINTYDCQYEYTKYSTTTFIEDVIYGLGMTLDKDKYRFATGLTKFKKVLMDHIKPFVS